MKINFIKQFSKTGESDFYIKDIKILSDIPFMPVSEINKLRREAFEDLTEKRLIFYNTEIKQKQKEMRYTKYFEAKVDYKANVHNNSAKEFYKNCDVEVIEPAFESQKPLHPVELMRCKHCIKYALNMCKSPLNLVLKDEKGSIYPLKFDCEHCEMYILSK